MKRIIKPLKEANEDQITAYCIPIKNGATIAGRLRPITVTSLSNQSEIERLANWRKNSQRSFTTQFKVTAEGTKKWLEEKIIQSDRNIIFVVENSEHIPIGQVGLCEIDDKKKYCLFDNILRGDPHHFKGGMKLACSTLLFWCFKELKMETVYLQVLSDNERAIQFYKDLGFQEIQQMPLIKRIEEGITKWVPLYNQPLYEVQRYLITMRATRL
ncbi:RimJ/RimL family protein N-acetyltransferase [Oikeobacillus pervagus]|uniref:RimJ/RimL family protein N-acetyltransferase n=1 Tax=Oikeobacillus pervagus TaxID=1325931 RepID=A0AAJ1WHN9_9BACI|nr:GNAT family protein [Oikeobacillus pervagus]MDQ0216407.1 RimJ/RimL family protein N-acetyltransferase [Oikeobacillus pervagus]